MRKPLFISIRTRLAVWLLLIFIATAMGVSLVVTQANTSVKQLIAEQLLSQALAEYRGRLAENAKLVPALEQSQFQELVSQQGTGNSELLALNKSLGTSFIAIFSSDGQLLTTNLQTINARHLGALQQNFADYHQSNEPTFLGLEDQIFQMHWHNFNAEQSIVIAQVLPTTLTKMRFESGAELQILPTQTLAELPATLQTELQTNLSNNPLNSDVDTQSLKVFLSEYDAQFHALSPLTNARDLQIHLSISLTFAKALAEETLKKILIVFALAGFAMLFFITQFSRGIVIPIQTLSKIAHALGRGESVKMQGKFKQDEIGELRQSLYMMQQNLHQRTQQLRHQANHDALTGLLNRLSACQQLDSHLLTQSLCLVQLTIKGFKEINQSLGFVSGDELLQQFARRFSDLEPEPLLSARLDSVEFLLVYANELSAQELHHLQQQLTNQYRLVNSSLKLNLAIGIAKVEQHADVGQSLRQVSLAAQKAMQDDSGLFYYHPAMDEDHQRRLTIIRDLPVTSQSDDFYVTYLPKIDLKTFQCVGAEALIRWNHPKLGVIPPDEFIRIAEYAGSIHFITQWMFNHVLQEQKIWHNQGLQLQISINLSVYDLLDIQLGEQLLKLLQREQLPANCLRLEVTESIVMNAPASAIERLHQIQQSGIELVLDKFGAGNSSLAFLKTLPVTEIKIDRMFVKNLPSDLRDQMIVATTTKLAHDFGFSVTAEGVEDVETLAILQQAGCNAAQGYYFTKPLPANEFGSWLKVFNQPKALTK